MFEGRSRADERVSRGASVQGDRTKSGMESTLDTRLTHAPPLTSADGQRMLYTLTVGSHATGNVVHFTAPVADVRRRSRMSLRLFSAGELCRLLAAQRLTPSPDDTPAEHTDAAGAPGPGRRPPSPSTPAHEPPAARPFAAHSPPLPA